MSKATKILQLTERSSWFDILSNQSTQKPFIRMKNCCRQDTLIRYTYKYEVISCLEKKFAVIKRSQATVSDGVVVPESELQNKIYCTPDLSFALAMAAGPSGITRLDNGTISFENESEFNPEQVIYVYEIDTEQLPEQLVEFVDDEQVAIDMDELVPVAMHEHLAKEVFDHYHLVEWKHLSISEFKLR